MIFTKGIFSELSKLKKDRILESNSEIEFIQPDYDGISKVLAELEKLYKVCDNKELLDKCLESFCFASKIINHKK